MNALECWFKNRSGPANFPARDSEPLCLGGNAQFVPSGHFVEHVQISREVPSTSLFSNSVFLIRRSKQGVENLKYGCASHYLRDDYLDFDRNLDID